MVLTLASPSPDSARQDKPARVRPLANFKFPPRTMACPPGPFGVLIGFEPVAQRRTAWAARVEQDRRYPRFAIFMPEPETESSPAD